MEIYRASAIISSGAKRVTVLDTVYVFHLWPTLVVWGCHKLTFDHSSRSV